MCILTIEFFLTATMLKFKIPKDKLSLSSGLHSYVCKFRENIFSTSGQIMCCKS